MTTPAPFAAPVGYGSDRFEDGSEYAAERAELAAFTIGPREAFCADCNMVHRPGCCDA